MSKKLLLISGDAAVQQELQAITRFVEYDITVLNGTQALDQLSAEDEFALCLLHLDHGRDMREAIAYLSDHHAQAPIHVLHNDASSEPVLPPGCEGTLKFPVKYRDLLATVQRAEQQAAASVKKRTHSELIGQSEAILAIKKLSAQVATTDAIVLLLGDSGTGKGMLARHIHSLSNRSGQAFVPVNCGAIPDDLLESELFGHEKGAFTGAISARRGRFEMAAGGTLFLDEIGDMPPAMQVKLLRVLQDKTYERVGGNRQLRNTTRIIAATHQDLEKDLESGKFRLDLFYRLNVFPIEIPPLRERPDDLPLLANAFYQRLEKQGLPPARLNEAALTVLSQQTLPGNVRELENLIERLSILFPGEEVGAAQLPARYTGGEGNRISLKAAPGSAPTSQESPAAEPEAASAEEALRTTDTRLPDTGINLKAHLADIERQLILDALASTSWVIAQAAKRLGLQRTTLVEKMRKLSINRDD